MNFERHTISLQVNPDRH